MSEELATAAGNLAELARLRSELAGVRDALAQRDRALVAAHRVIEIAQADNVALKQELEDRHICATCGGKGSYWTDVGGEAEHEVCDCWIRADHVLHHEEHPGAAMLAELGLARALADSVTAFFNKRGWSHAIMIGNDDILAMSEALSNYGAVEQRKARET